MAIKKSDIEYWESQSIEKLEELAQHNDNIIKDHTQQVSKVKECNVKIEQILKKKREEQATKRLIDQEESIRFVLNMMEHSLTCKHNKSTNYTPSYNIPGIHENGKCYCSKCALEYLLENPWMGVNFRITAEFDVDGDGFYE